MPTYSAAVLDDIRAGVDIVDFIGRFVNLRKAGTNWKGLCPFHGEKTPSFMVNPKKGIFHCFGCGVGGDVFGFLMRQDRLSFPEAVRALVEYAFEVLGADVVRIYADGDNVASHRVAEKSGLLLVERFRHEEDGEAWFGVRYELSREERSATSGERDG